MFFKRYVKHIVCERQSLLEICLLYRTSCLVNLNIYHKILFRFECFLEAPNRYRRENSMQTPPTNKSNDISHLHFRDLSPVIKSDEWLNQNLSLLHIVSTCYHGKCCCKNLGKFPKKTWVQQHFCIICCSLKPTAFDWDFILYCLHSPYLFFWIKMLVL